MKSFPFAMMLNTRIGPDALATRVAKVFGVKYVPSDRNLVDDENIVKISQTGEKAGNEVKRLGIKQILSQKSLAKRVEQVLDWKQTKKTVNYDVNIDDVFKSKFDKNGKKCVDKIVLVEETEYDDIIECNHSYDRRCHITYVTKYVAQENQVCEDNYKRDCIIEFEKVAVNETIAVCRKHLVKDCDVEGVDVCRTEYQSECFTINKQRQVIQII